jgi:hypothetical protein
MGTSTNQNSDESGRPADDADWVEAASEAFERWRTASDMKALSRSVAILGGAAPRMIMDPLRTQLAAEIGGALLDVSVGQARPDVLDHAVGLLTRELSFIDRALDPSGTALVAASLAMLLAERFYLSGGLEDLAAALDLYGNNAEYVEAFAGAFDDRDRASFWWGFGKAHQHKATVAKQRAEYVAAVVCLGKAAAALTTDSAFGRRIRGDLAVAKLELLERDGADKNPSREYRDQLEQTIDILRGLADSGVSGIDRGRWLQNLAIVLRQRSELWPPQDPRRQADLREALAVTEQGLQAHDKSNRKQ